MYAFHVLRAHGLRDYRFSFTVIRTAIGDHTTHTVHTKLATFRFCRGEKKNLPPTLSQTLNFSASSFP